MMILTNKSKLICLFIFLGIKMLNKNDFYYYFLFFHVSGCLVLYFVILAPVDLRTQIYKFATLKHFKLNTTQEIDLSKDIKDLLNVMKNCSSVVLKKNESTVTQPNVQLSVIKEDVKNISTGSYPLQKPVNYTDQCSRDAQCSEGCDVCCKLPYHNETGQYCHIYTLMFILEFKSSMLSVCPTSQLVR